MKNSDSRRRIAELLNMLGISQTEFCKKAGIQKSALSNYLNGDREPRQTQIAKIADAFNVNPAWLMGYDVPMQFEEVETFDTPEAFEAHWNRIGGGRHPIKLSDEEYTMVTEYRSADQATQQSIKRLLAYYKLMNGGDLHDN